MPVRLREHGVIVKRRCRDCLSVALLYPAVYSGAVASLVYQSLYYMINELEYAYAERFVASKMYGEEEPPQSLETGAPLTKFDVIIVPISYELDYATLSRILVAAGIDPLRGLRRKDHPLVVVGGPVPSTNPLIAMEMADLVLVGEAEPLIPQLLEALYEYGRQGVEKLACKPGFLTNECTNRVRKVYAKDLDSTFHPVMEFRVPGSGEPWGEAYMVEITRGCPFMCSFCLIAHFTLPFRWRSYNKIVELISRGVKVNRVNRVAFYTLSFFSHPDADKILDYLLEEGLEASIGSLRVDMLNEERVEKISRLGQRVLTIAPETLIPRLCRVLRKCIAYELVRDSIKWAVKYDMHAKLYMIVGIPGEELDDVRYEALMIRRLVEEAKASKNTISLSVNPLIPKPWTPLQWSGLIDKKEYEERVKALRDSGIAVDALPYRYAYAQTVIARGDREVAHVIREWGLMGGTPGMIKQAAKRVGVKLDKYVKPLSLDEDPPWTRYVDLGYPAKALRVAATVVESWLRKD